MRSHVHATDMLRASFVVVLCALASGCGSSDSNSGATGGTSGSGGAGGSGGGTGGATGGSSGTGTGGGSAGTDAGSDASTPGTFIDPRDGHAYTEVSVAGATWMGENLAWEAPGGSFCYENDPANCTSAGRLYNFDVAQTACPTGWHLSTDDDWKTLETSLGMPPADLDIDNYTGIRGTDEGTKLKAAGSSGLDFPMSGYATTNGNTAVMWDGLTTGTVRTYIWTATSGGTGVYRRRIEQNEAHVFRFSNPPNGFAIVVRCVKD
jgi:uncharacterized protein (TIGR02145 family)